MPRYLFEVNNRPEGYRGVRAMGGSAVRSQADAVARSVGGTIESYYFAFGGTDAYIIADLPDYVAAAAAALAVNAQGAGTVKTTVLLTTTEMDAAVGRDVSFPPSGS